MLGLSWRYGSVILAALLCLLGAWGCHVVVPRIVYQVLGLPNLQSWPNVKDLAHADAIRSWKSGFPQTSDLKAVRSHSALFSLLIDW